MNRRTNLRVTYHREIHDHLPVTTLANDCLHCVQCVLHHDNWSVQKNCFENYRVANVAQNLGNTLLNPVRTSDERSFRSMSLLQRYLEYQKYLFQTR